MAMSVGSDRSGVMSEINVTPMVDVMLVLLIIFMVATPTILAGFQAQLPDGVYLKPRPEMDDRVVLEIDAAGQYTINTQPVAQGELMQRLTEIYANRPDKVLFIKADGEVTYQQVIAVMDAARGAGVTVLGAVLP